jgi:hypothetical protein
MNNDAAGASPVDCRVRPLVAEARWYCVSREGMATLCKDEEDARANAAHCDQAWRAGGPHRAVRLVDLQRPLTRQHINAVMTEHYPLDSLLRENVDAFEACVRDLERLHGIGA